MNSKPFEMRYLIASDWSVESFTWKGPEKLRGYEKFFGSFEKRKNCFLSFAFHAKFWGESYCLYLQYNGYLVTRLQT